MSDDWETRRELGDEHEKDDAGEGRAEAGGWAEEPEPGHFRSHWPEDEEASPGEASSSGWPTSAPPWRTSAYGDSRREWERDPFAEDAAADRYDRRHSRDPLARLFPGLPRGVRVALDWILTIAGAILIVLALKQWVVNPYRIPSSSMEPTLNCAKGPANPGCLGNSSDRVLACRICLDFGSPSRGDIVVFNTPTEAALKCGEGGTFVKRVVGLPGETVHEDDKGFILIKKPGWPEFVKLKEPYLPASSRLADSQHFGQTWTVPPGT